MATSRSLGSMSLTTRSPMETVPLGHLLEPGHHAQRRRLAAARRAEEHEQLAVGDVQRQVVDGGGVAEALGDAVEADLCQRAPFGRPACRPHGSIGAAAR